MLASNESCFAPHPAVVEAAGARARRRPTATRTRPTRRCAARWPTATASRPQRIALGNGSCDILLAAGEALLEPGAEVVYAWPAFSVYPHLAAASGARAIEVPLDDEDRHDLDAIATEVTVATRLVLICNPNNPTSTALGLDEIEAFLRRGPASRVRDPRRGLLRVRADPRRHRTRRSSCSRKHPNLVLLRTFSKVYGLAGLRVGYALCGAEDFRVAVDQVRQPFYLNAAAQAAAVEALTPPGRGRASGDRDDRAPGSSWPTGSARSGLWVAESDANFIWLHLPEDVEEADVVDGSAGPRRAGPRRSGARPRRLAAGHRRHRRRERALRATALKARPAWHRRPPSGTKRATMSTRSRSAVRLPRLYARLRLAI